MAPTAGTRLRMKQNKKKVVKKTKSTKNQIRGLERLLRNPNLDSAIRLKKEQELQSLQEELTKKNDIETDKKRAMKYRMVKFFERRKLLRKSQQLEKKATDSSLDPQQQQVIDDLKYIFFYPKGLKYISLFPKQDKKPDAKTIEKQTQLKKQAIETFAKTTDPKVLKEFQEFCTINSKASSGSLPKDDELDDDEEEVEDGENQATIETQEDEDDEDDFFL